VCTSHEDITFMLPSRWIILRMRNVSEKSCRENQNARLLFCNFLFARSSCSLRNNVEKCCRARRTIYVYNMAHAHCFLDNQDCNTIRLCNIHCFSTAITVTRTRLSISLCVLFDVTTFEATQCCFVVRFNLASNLDNKRSLYEDRTWRSEFVCVCPYHYLCSEVT
jgi:hypothetical protein